MCSELLKKEKEKVKDKDKLRRFLVLSWFARRSRTSTASAASLETHLYWFEAYIKGRPILSVGYGVFGGHGAQQFQEM